MLKLGITGGIGSGKSVVSTILVLSGVPVYIADDESKKLTTNSPAIRKKLIAVFGENLYDGNKLNKELFAACIFSDKQKLQTANSIIHPEVALHYEQWLKTHRSEAVVVLESAILFETGWNTKMDRIVTVYAPLDTRIQRVMERQQAGREAILERIGNQLSDEEKIHLSDYVIYNDGSQSVIEQTLKIVEQIQNHE